MKDISEKVFVRGVIAPHRLLFDTTTKGNFRIYHHRIAIFRGYDTTSLEDVRQSLLKRGLSEGQSLALGPNPDDLTPKQRLTHARANIRRRAAKVRPRLKGG